MIIRILGDGQYEFDPASAPAFDQLDADLLAHIEAGDEEAYHRDLAELIALVRAQGAELANDSFSASDLVLPDPLLSLAEVRDLLAEEGQSA